MNYSGKFFLYTQHFVLNIRPFRSLYEAIDLPYVKYDPPQIVVCLVFLSAKWRPCWETLHNICEFHGISLSFPQEWSWKMYFYYRLINIQILQTWRSLVPLFSSWFLVCTCNNYPLWHYSIIISHMIVIVTIIGFRVYHKEAFNCDVTEEFLNDGFS